MTTKIETEAKIKLNEMEFYSLFNILNEAEKFSGDLWAVNNCKKLRTIYYGRGEEILRTRYIIPNFSDGNFVVLNKKSFFGRDDSLFKPLLEEEISIKIDGENIKNICQFFGFSEIFRYDKTRFDYKQWGTIISLDIINSGKKKYFIEVEGNEKNISRVIKKLNLENKSQEKRSYLEILSGGKYGMH